MEQTFRYLKNSDWYEGENVKITEFDNVEVNLEDGHKYAICDIKKGENVIKYGFVL